MTRIALSKMMQRPFAFGFKLAHMLSFVIVNHRRPRRIIIYEMIGGLHMVYAVLDGEEIGGITRLNSCSHYTPPHMEKEW